MKDSPYFREILKSHEKELDRTSRQIKELVKHVKNVVDEAKRLSEAQNSLAAKLIEFEFEPIGSKQTEDEEVITSSLKIFGNIITGIEDARQRMLEGAYETFIAPLENFRKDQIAVVMENKKKYDKLTKDFCNNQVRVT